MATNTVTGKIERKYMAHFVNTKFNSSSGATYSRIGSDLEEFSVDLAPNIETKSNIIGETSVKHNGYEATSSVDSYMCSTEDPLFPVLQDIVDNRHAGDQCKTDMLEVHLWETSGTEGSYVAYKQPCYIIPSSYGGDTGGYQIPFEVRYFGERKKGTFNLSTKSFT